MPCHPARARKLLKKKKAAVFRRYPFTIIMTHRVGGDLQPVEIKFDPGSRTTGIALIGHFDRGERGYLGEQFKPPRSPDQKSPQLKTGNTQLTLS
jgi:hypothetical protein